MTAPLELNADLRATMAAHLNLHDRLELPLEGRRHAAVAIVIVESDVRSEASFVLCRRSAGLRAHAAQWALPGGRLDDGETSTEAALRETHEEIGVLLEQSAVLGLLDDYATRSGYVMTPVVVWGGAVELDPNPDEVLAAYRFGLHELRREGSPRFVSIPESDRPVVQIPLGDDLVHAPTGAVLAQFRYVAIDGMTGDPCRVAHFEQPVFAWG